MAIIQSKGLQKKYGFELKIIPMASPAATQIAIHGHQADVTFASWQPFAVLRSKGEDTVIIAPVNHYVNGVIVKKDSGIKSMKDLVGKKLGTFYTPNTGTALIFQYAVNKEFGFDPYAATDLREGATPLLLGLFEKGEIDALFLGEPNVTKSLVSGNYRLIWHVTEAFKKLGREVPLQLCAITTDQSLRTQKEQLKKFIAAYTEAKDIVTNDPQVWKELAKEVEIKGDEGAEMLRKSLQPSYVQTWNKSFIENEVKISYEMAALQKGVKFIPDKIPEGLFSFDIYSR